MKKIFTLLAATLMSAATMTAEPLFSTTFETQADFNAWIVKDANGDEKTWYFDATATPSHCLYSYSSANQANDWLISPEIVPAKTGSVAVIYTYSGSSYGESMEVYIGKGTTPEEFTDLKATHPVINADTHNAYVLVDAVEGEAFRVAFRATSNKDLFRLYLCTVEANHVDNPMDLGVSAITSPVTGMELGEESVTITVNNYGDKDASNFELAYQIDENEPVVETYTGTISAGGSVEYTFNTKADLSIPRKLYTVKAYTNVEGDLNPNNDKSEVKVLHQAPAAVPYYLGFEPEEETSGITFYNLNNDDGEWAVEVDGGWTKLARTGSGSLAYNYDGSNAGDDWAILEPITVEPGYYVLKFWYSVTDGHPEKFSVHYGNGATPDAMTNKIVEFAPATNSTYQESINIIHIEDAQSIYIGFYSFTPKDENWIMVDDLSFEKIDGESVDLSVNGISAPFDFVRPGNGTNVVFELRNIGIAEAQATVEVSIDAEVKHSETITLAGQEFKSVEVKDLIAGLSVGKHTVAVELTSEGDTNVDNNKIEKEIVVLPAATKLWDFEDGQIPSDFTYEVFDEGTINPDAGDEFNEYGWGIFRIGAHEMLGSYMLAGTTWLDGVYKADRSIILPAFDVLNEDSYFVWDAKSYSSFLESYGVMIQDNGASYPYFSTKYAQVAESVTPVTRGISLADYVGQNISICFNLRTANGEHLNLDNIGIYDLSDSGVDNVVVSPIEAIAISDNEIEALGAVNITVTDMLGRMVASVDAERLDISILSSGIYVATVKSADKGVQSIKFVKK